ncbi:Pfs domain protein [Aspergillus brunneoviolaceus CBS 621.78]|uniref:Uncharacterized protein n=1 Tax=Aspergillus brunneoviolaceus CBS 621.78 TaxID=1450534 RepID=A0ACD1G054_9EURO|nr:hypothetical protein BO95DRAFT_370500 [Aspergillus brunneoviolaceus CBS 621.78]RAH42641.1 hypothetical protein BO95DRAFT_370500 [Aspergillus brunneoviolaceus CBS 621.78]
MHPKREEDVAISTGNKIALGKTESQEGGSASDENDRESIYSRCSNNGDGIQACMHELAADLAKAVDIYDLNHEVIQDIVKALPELLTAFALSLGQASSSQTQRDIMVFIHQHRRLIATMFEQALLSRSTEFLKQRSAKARSVDDTMWFEGQQNDEALHSMSLPHRELADRRKSRMKQSETVKSGEDTTTANNNSEAGSSRSQTQNYLLLIQASSAYSLLLKRIRRERMIALPGPRHGARIRETILEALPKTQRISRRAPSQSFNITLKTYWDPVIFMEEQRYEETADYAFERVITTTGCFSSAQALTIWEYMDQTWPCTGCDVLSLVKTTITKGVKEPVTLVDGTRVTCTRGTFAEERSSRQMLFEICGTGPAIAEIGEQVAWMASALRTCPLEGMVVYSKPIVHTTRPHYGGHSPQSAFLFELTVELRESMKSIEPLNGQCWHRMMASPVVVEGFPIRRRPSHASEGLELPLGMLAQLVDTTRVSRFDEKTLLKGFTSIAIVTGYSQNIVSWHFTQENRGRMSHLRSEEWPGLSVAVHALKAARHVVGWCPEIKLFAGQQGASYSIGNTGLPYTIEEQELFSTSTLSAGPILADGIRPVLGQRDIRAPRSSFIKKMKWLFQKYVVLWDEADQRGWLVNGASALLHLIRASIYEDRRDSISEAARHLHEDQLHEAKRPYQWDSAFQLLVHPINRKINMSGSGENLITFQDRAEDYFTLLEQAIDIQLRATSRRGTAGKKPRSLLGGWDFRDLTTEDNPIYLRQTVLPLEGRSWVDLTRAIYAVTLFGRGFGDIIQPANWPQPFAEWNTVPTGRFYLTASARDIRNIAEANGDPDSYPARLTHDLLWCSTKASSTHPLQKFEERSKSTEHVDMLVPVAMLSEAQETTVASDWDVGAMIFGFNPDDAWYWADYGYPTRSKPAVQELGPDYFKDSAGDSQIPSIYTGVRRSSACGASQTMEQGLFNLANTTAGPSEHILHQPSNRKLTLAHYTVGIICALQHELMAVRVLFDEVFEPVTMPAGDHNHYVLGRIAEHNVVGVCLQHGSDSTESARKSVHYIKHSFPGIRFCLLVGMGAGTPFDAHDIRLGDVIVSDPRRPYSGVIPYDITQTPLSGPLTLNGFPLPPPTDLTQAISALESNPDGATASLDRYIRQIELLKIQYQHPDPDPDRLFLSCYSHALPSDPDCHRCWSMFELRRPPRPTLQPCIHYGLIASSTAIPRAGYHRDLLIKAHNILCFETEAAGIVDVYPCVLIRGICDYGDSHRNTRWQHYAAATAAAYAKVLLASVNGADIHGYGHAHMYGNTIGGRDPVERKRRRESPDSGAGVGSSKRPGMFYGA